MYKSLLLLLLVVLAGCEADRFKMVIDGDIVYRMDSETGETFRCRFIPNGFEILNSTNERWDCHEAPFKSLSRPPLESSSE